ncbi:hypothetical protein ACU639_34020 [Streptomyces cynarae]|uniref:hypothetical protein n=1 Tax=Streptomyces cynarae TaxID=2981134 RepID=UPI00406C9619
MSRTVSAWVTSGEDVLGVTGPFPVDVPWWSEVEQVVGRLEEVLGVHVTVLRLLTVDGGEGGRDGHATYHAEAWERPASGLLGQRAAPEGLLAGDATLRMCPKIAPSALGEDAVLLGALATALGTARDVVFERRSATS